MNHDTYQQLLQEVDTFKSEFERFSGKSIKVAGTRARKSLNEIKKLSLNLRREILDHQKTL